ncbi:MAG: SDR family oxidoreductase [Myxococcota bacterium]
MSLSALFRCTGPTGFGAGSTAEGVTQGLDLRGKNVLVTGCNSGLGYETMRVLTMRGARVLGCARTDEKARQACDSVVGPAEPFVCELSEPDSVRACVEAVREFDQPIDAIICNAGIMALPELEQIYGYERQFFTNHIGHFILVTGLLEQLSNDGRVVMVSSYGHKVAPGEGIQFDNLSGEHGYASWPAYGQSKLANLLFARELARRFGEGDTDRVANAIHPGVINTNLGRHMNPVMRAGMTLGGKLFFKTTEQGAATQTYVAVHPDAADLNGEYFADCNLAGSSRNSRDADLAKRLWEESERIVAEVAPSTNPGM